MDLTRPNKPEQQFTKPVSSLVESNASLGSAPVAPRDLATVLPLPAAVVEIDLPMHEYAFDCKLQAAIRVHAISQQAAEAELRDVLECADVNAGSWNNGEPVLFEASVHGALSLYEMDGEFLGDEIPVGQLTDEIDLDGCDAEHDALVELFEIADVLPRTLLPENYAVLKESFDSCGSNDAEYEILSGLTSHIVSALKDGSITRENANGAYGEIVSHLASFTVQKDGPKEVAPADGFRYDATVASTSKVRVAQGDTAWLNSADLDALPAGERVILLHQDGEISTGHLECDAADPDDMSKDFLESHETGLSPIVGWLPLSVLPRA